MRYLLFLGTLLAFTTNAQARLGESIEQCNKRYEKPILIEKEEQIIHYLKNGIKVKVYFHKSKADCIFYRLRESKPLSDHMINQLLKVNGKNWKKFKTTDEAFYYLDNNNRVAGHNFMKHFLMIWTKGNKDRYEAAKKAAEDEALSDF